MDNSPSENQEFRKKLLEEVKTLINSTNPADNPQPGCSGTTSASGLDRMVPCGQSNRWSFIPTTLQWVAGVKRCHSTAGISNRQEAMKRSFPNIYEGKVPTKGVEKRNLRDFRFVLRHKNTACLPTAQQTSTLLAAGLGEKSISLDVSATHEEIKCCVENVYPKLKAATGGWVLKRKAPLTRTKLELITAPYRGESLKTYTRYGAPIYVVPLQDELCLDPIGGDEQEFDGTPKVTCKKCGTDVPINCFEIHHNICPGSEATVKPTDATNEVPEVIEIKSEASASLVSLDEIDDDDDLAYQKAIEDSLTNLPTVSHKEPLIVGDHVYAHSLTEKEAFFDKTTLVIKKIKDTCNNKFTLRINRNSILGDTLKKMGKSYYDSKCILKIDFINESSVDGGGPFREFFRLFLDNLTTSQYLVKSARGYCLNKCRIGVSQNVYKHIGEILVKGIIQEGKAPRLFSPTLMDYWLNGEEVTKPKIEDCAQYTSFLLQKINQAKTLEQFARLQNEEGISKLLLASGFAVSELKPTNVQKILDVVLRNEVLYKVTPELENLKKGLQIHGFLENCRLTTELVSLICCNPQNDHFFISDFGDFLTHLRPEYSSQGSNRRLKEEVIYGQFIEFLEDLEHEEVKTQLDDGITYVLNKDKFVTCTGFSVQEFSVSRCYSTERTRLRSTNEKKDR